MGFKALAASAAAALLFSTLAAAQTDKAVYAHFMVGIVRDYTVEDWKTDMEQAKEIGIDGFALNCAPPRVDSYTPKQLANAYEAAAQVTGFTVFVSFDFAYWQNDDTELITGILANYSAHPAQALYGGAQIASTFVGDSFDWGPVKAALGSPLAALPHLQDPIEAQNNQKSIDGALSWYAWPTDGGNSIKPGPISTIWDEGYFKYLEDRVYLAPVSPWFFTHFNSKNWVFICEQLITDRWEQMLALKPGLIEIITWNDYGESHYIGGPEPNHDDDGSSQWADGFPHDGWARIMKPYIAAYKAGADKPTVEQDELVYWYRPTPKDVQCSNDTLPAPQGIEYLQDLVFVTTMLTAPGTLTVTSGTQAPVSVEIGAGIVTTNFTMGVGKQSFSLARDGAAVLGGDGGLDIQDSCDKYNFNAYVGSFGGAAGSPGPEPPVTATTDAPTTTTSAGESGTTSTDVSSSTASETPAPSGSCGSLWGDAPAAPVRKRRIFTLGRFHIDVDEN